jgi:hypothetical protein
MEATLQHSLLALVTKRAAEKHEESIIHHKYAHKEFGL